MNPSISFDDLRAQFEGLEGRHPGLWPRLPRLLCCVMVAGLVVALGGWLVWTPQWESLAQGESNERQLGAAFEHKIAQAQHLELLRRQKAEVEAQVLRQQQQLPGKSDMDALLAEISQVGVVRGLQIELFKPGQLKLGEHYAELPIEMRVTGTFHALAGFVSDLTNMSRIVTVDHMAITQQRDGVLIFECVAHAFRYLDPAEAEQIRRATTDRKQRAVR